MGETLFLCIRPISTKSGEQLSQYCGQYSAITSLKQLGGKNILCWDRHPFMSRIMKDSEENVTIVNPLLNLMDNHGDVVGIWDNKRSGIWMLALVPTMRKKLPASLSRMAKSEGAKEILAQRLKRFRIREEFCKS